MHRGARKAPIFKVATDCTGFLEIVADTVERFELEVHAYSLMPNHYHLLARSRLGNLSRCMQHLNGTYTQWLNQRHRWDGPVFRGRFKNQLVTDEEHLRILVAYIHLNPVVAGLVSSVGDEAWTSFRAYMNKDPAPDWLTTEFFLDLFGGKLKLGSFVESYRVGRREFPDTFNPDTGLFARKAIEADARKPVRKATRPGRTSRNQDPALVLRKICRITKTDKEQLRRSQHGPRANPARRFAIWALNRSTGLTNRQIGALLDVSYHQVSKVLGALRKATSTQPVGGWISRWIAEQG
jgi:REP element-mobilizing transposase RayT